MPHRHFMGLIMKLELVYCLVYCLSMGYIDDHQWHWELMVGINEIVVASHKIHVGTLTSCVIKLQSDRACPEEITRVLIETRENRTK